MEFFNFHICHIIFFNFLPKVLEVFFLLEGPAGRSNMRVHRSRQDGVPAPRVRERGRQHGDGGARLRCHDSHGGHTISCCLRHPPGPASGRSGAAGLNRDYLELPFGRKPTLLFLVGDNAQGGTFELAGTTAANCCQVRQSRFWSQGKELR